MNSQRLNASIEWKGLIPGINEMRRHYGNYLRGLPNIREYRQRLVTVNQVEDIEPVLDQIENHYDGYVFERRTVPMEAMANACG